ncbi:MAG: cellobiose phosphorylase [Lachnospiraceae bacterium]|nr:cellobiose phosphorylase [Lachnospiraceae bacterium]
MSSITYSEDGRSFFLEDPGRFSYLYFPLADENGVMSCVTPSFGGDSKTGQNSFLLEPVTSESLHANRSSRNFWILREGKLPWSAAGMSDAQIGAGYEAAAGLEGAEKEKVILEAGAFWQKVTRVSLDGELSAQITAFVPHTKERCELIRLRIANESASPVKLRPVTAIPIYGRSADNIRDHRNVTSMLNRITVTDCGVCNRPTLTFDERGHQINRLFYSVYAKLSTENAQGILPEGALPTVDALMGEGGSLTSPLGLLDLSNAAHAGDAVDGFEAMGGLVFPEISLEPGEAAVLITALAYGDPEEDLKGDRFTALLSPDVFERLLEESKAHWQEQNNITYHTADPLFDRFMKWVNYQPILRRIYGCSFLPHHDYGRGGRGWRDLWQDCLALLLMNPGGVRELLKSNCAGVRIDGSNATIIGAKPGEFLADRNGIPRVWMDHGMWPYLTVELYLDQTGDLEFLLEPTPYFKDALGGHGDLRDEVWKPEEGCLQKTSDGAVYEGTVLEHLLLENLTFARDLGEHGHIRLRGADWNDALDMARDRGESIPFTAMYAANLRALADLSEKLGKRAGTDSLELLADLELLLDAEKGAESEALTAFARKNLHSVSGGKKALAVGKLAEDLRRIASQLEENIRSREWIDGPEDCGWFNSYYDNDGQPLEGYDPASGRADMMLTGQVFTVMSGTASEEQTRKISRAADRYLFAPQLGGYRLNTDFHEVKLNMGRMFGFSYGQKENGAVFCHMAVMYANALYRRGFCQEGFRALNALALHASDTPHSRIYPGIPEYFDPTGRGVYHYLTGAGSWLLLTVVREVFGIRGLDGDLYFAPRLLPDQYGEDGKAGITVPFAGVPLRVVYRNPKKLPPQEYEPDRILLDGKPYDALCGREGVPGIRRADLEKLDPSKEHQVEVYVSEEVRGETAYV